jgi:hypothetical protein
MEWLLLIPLAILAGVMQYKAAKRMVDQNPEMAEYIAMGIWGG